MTDPAAEYTIAELREHLREAIDATARGPVRITRRGAAVAQLVSADAEVAPPERDWFDAVLEWRERPRDTGVLANDDIFENVRDRSDTGRDVDFTDLL